MEGCSRRELAHCQAANYTLREHSATHARPASLLISADSYCFCCAQIFALFQRISTVPLSNLGSPATYVKALAYSAQEGRRTGFNRASTFLNVSLAPFVSHKLRENPIYCQFDETEIAGILSSTIRYQACWLPLFTTKLRYGFFTLFELPHCLHTASLTPSCGLLRTFRAVFLVHFCFTLFNGFQRLNCLFNCQIGIESTRS